MLSENLCVYYDAEFRKWYELVHMDIENGYFSRIESYAVDIASKPFSKYILPGFIDAHVHLLEDPYSIEHSDLIYHKSFENLWLCAKKNMQDALKGGVTSVKDLGGRNLRQFHY